jgi:prephenate dehydrogenase
MSSGYEAAAAATAAKDLVRALMFLVSALRGGSFDPVTLRRRAAEISPESLRLSMWRDLYRAASTDNTGKLSEIAETLQAAAAALEKDQELASGLISDPETVDLLNKTERSLGSTALTLGI